MSKPASIRRFESLSIDTRWGHRGYWVAVNSTNIVDKDKMFTELVKRVRMRGDWDSLFVEFIP